VPRRQAQQALVSVSARQDMVVDIVKRHCPACTVLVVHLVEMVAFPKESLPTARVHASKDSQTLTVELIRFLDM